MLYYLTKKCLKISLYAFGWGAIALCTLLIYLFAQLPDVTSLSSYQYKVPMRIYSADHELIAEFGQSDCLPIGIEDIPIQVQQAIVAIEDHRFYDHWGVDFIGLARAARHVLQSGHKSQGGSTITMQVARNFFLSREKTYLRKINEILLSFNIEAHYSKQAILEMYLNKIYFGKQAYGIQAAAHNYYGKTVDQLTLAESAMLAGLPKAPSRNNPITRPHKAIERRNQVLANMRDMAFIDEQAYQQAIHEEDHASFHHLKPTVNARYAAELVRQYLVDSLGEENAYTKGYEITTTIDAKAQSAARSAAIKEMVHYAKSQKLWHLNVDGIAQHDWTYYLNRMPTFYQYQVGIVANIDDEGHTLSIQTNDDEAHLEIPSNPSIRKDLFVGAVVLMDDQHHLVPISPAQIALVSANDTGSVIAMIGGNDFRIQQYNAAVYGARQPGSLIKPFIYATALQHQYTLASMINDAPIVRQGGGHNIDWRPNNDDHHFRGMLSLRKALTSSRNLVAIRLVMDLGINTVSEQLTQMGFDPKLMKQELGLALGGSLEATPQTINNGFAMLQNNGQSRPGFLIHHVASHQDPKVMDKLNTPLIAPGLWAFAPTETKQIIDHSHAFLINDVLKDVMTIGTARKAKRLKRHDLYGKTGTTNNKHDAWFAGFNGDIVTTIWMGYNQNKHLNAYGGQAALPVWLDYMDVMLQGVSEHPVDRPDDIISVRTDPKTGQPSGNPKHPFELFTEQMLDSLSA